MHLLSAQTAAVALLTARVFGHPAPASNSAHSVQKRTVDFKSFKLAVGSSYSNSLVTTDETPQFRSFSAATYTETATSLVQKVAPDAEFRLLSNYVSGNGIGHVVFKQTLHGLDIDNADFNVNVGKDGKVFSFGNSFYSGALPSDNPCNYPIRPHSVTVHDS